MKHTGVIRAAAMALLLAGCATTPNSELGTAGNMTHTCDTELPRGVLEQHKCFNAEFAKMADELDAATATHRPAPPPVAHVQLALRQMADVPIGPDGSGGDIHFALVSYQAICGAPGLINSCQVVGTMLAGNGKPQLAKDIAEVGTLCSAINQHADEILAREEQNRPTAQSTTGGGWVTAGEVFSALLGSAAVYGAARQARLNQLQSRPIQPVNPTINCYSSYAGLTGQTITTCH